MNKNHLILVTKTNLSNNNWTKRANIKNLTAPVLKVSIFLKHDKGNKNIRHTNIQEIQLDSIKNDSIKNNTSQEITKISNILSKITNLSTNVSRARFSTLVLRYKTVKLQKTYRSFRLAKGYPVNGQRTKSNGRTAKKYYRNMITA